MKTFSHPSVALIRRRLNLLLLRAFLVVVTLIIVLLLGMTGLTLSQPDEDDSIFTLALPVVLETYYHGHGSWEGVETLFVPDGNSALWVLQAQWERSTLVDEGGRVIFVDGQVAASTPILQAQIPTNAPDTALKPAPTPVPSTGAASGSIPLVVQGKQVGTLIRSSQVFSLRLRVIGSVLLPVAFISIFLGLLTMFIGMLLTRRVVTPLAEVIAASQSVAGGDLAARVLVQGPDDLRVLTDSFNQMAGALERSQAERRALLADIAHELRTPLTVIRGKLEGILDGVYPADEAHVAPVLEETYLLERLVEDLRLLTLAEAGQLHFDEKPLDLGDLANQARTLFEAQAAEKGITLQVKTQPGLPYVRGDLQRTAQVIGNLLNNALDFTPEGGNVLVAVDATDIKMAKYDIAASSSSPGVKGVRLTVSDTGPGVPPEELDQIFDRFWRGEKSRARQTGGSGLGLAIVRQLVEMQGGIVFAENSPEGGLKIGFVLKPDTPVY